MIWQRFTAQHVLVLGLGASGTAAAELALRHGASVTVLDGAVSTDLEHEAERLSNRGAAVKLDWSDERWSAAVDLAVISPGIPPLSRLGRLAATLDCPVISELEFGYHYCACPILAVTGTNGKTTTVELTVHALKAAGRNVLGAGNLGLPLSAAARRSAGLDVLVVEASSFQLERVREFTPLAAALLNVTDDHLDRYADRDAYLRAKLNIFRNVRQPGAMILDHRLQHLEQIRRLPALRAGTPVTTATQPVDDHPATYAVDADGWICRHEAGKSTRIAAVETLKLRGPHHLANILTCMALCRAVRVGPETVVGALPTFAVGAHRQELVTVARGVRFVDDSKATNPDAMIQALRTFGRRNDGHGNIILIAGGRGKNLDFTPVIPFVREYVREAYLIGETREQLTELLAGHTACLGFSSIPAVVDAVLDSARSGETVMLSPGCASQDMFIDYAERGDLFTNELRRRLEA